jgi:predicted RNA-binding protein with PUA-like domain
VVEFKPVEKLKRPVSLSEIKATKSLAEMELVKLGRLSVSAVTDEEWNIILALSETR